MQKSVLRLVSLRHRAHLIVLALLLAAAAPLLAAAPAGYYDSVDTSSPQALRQTVHVVIKDHKRYPYSSSSEIDTRDILALADEDPGNSGDILDLYENASYPKDSTSWNREHSWPKSYGFPVDSPDNYPYTDCHHLFAADVTYNADRSNKPFRDCSSACTEEPTVVGDGQGGGSGVYPGNSNWTTGDYAQGTWETWSGRRGDVARALLYLDVRYEGGVNGITGQPEPDLRLTDDESLIAASQTGANESVAYMGMLSVLLEWNQQDPVDDRERHRNDVVYSFQGNRNPFIDHPEWVACVYQGVCSGSADTTPPAAPAGLVATGGDGSVDLDWLANGEADLAGYDLYRGTAAGGPYSQVNGALLTGPSARDAAVVNDTTYFYVVRAVDSSGNASDTSNEAVATPQGSGTPGRVVLSEVFYDPSGTDDGLEWVEALQHRRHGGRPLRL